MNKRFAIFVLLFAPACLFAQDGGVSLRADPAYFSPNDDGIQDQLFFYPVLQRSSDVMRWRLDLLKEHGGRVARLTGPGFPSLIKWDGIDSKGRSLKEGAYTAQLSIWGKESKQITSINFWVDITPPQVTVAVSTPVFDKSLLGGGGITFTPQASDVYPIDRWQFQLIDHLGRTIFVDWSTGPVRSVVWDGTDPATHVLVPAGSYRAVFGVWDKAGNESAPVFSDVTMNVNARDMLANSLHLLQIFETPIGLIVQFPAAALFDFKGTAINLSTKAGPLIQEAAILVNAYPEVPVKLDGYSLTQKTAAADRDRGSLYAWRVYSGLVKQGRVAGSRVTVRGRGRSPMFDRRAVNVPILRDGVEVILEGYRDW